MTQMFPDSIKDNYDKNKAVTEEYREYINEKLNSEIKKSFRTGYIFIDHRII